MFFGTHSRSTTWACRLHMRSSLCMRWTGSSAPTELTRLVASAMFFLNLISNWVHAALAPAIIARVYPIFISRAYSDQTLSVSTADLSLMKLESGESSPLIARLRLKGVSSSWILCTRGGDGLQAMFVEQTLYVISSTSASADRI